MAEPMVPPKPFLLDHNCDRTVVAQLDLHPALRIRPRQRGQVTLAGRGLVQANGSSNEGRESLLIDFIVLVEVDCAPGVAFEA